MSLDIGMKIITRLITQNVKTRILVKVKTKTNKTTLGEKHGTLCEDLTFAEHPNKMRQEVLRWSCREVTEISELPLTPQIHVFQQLRLQRLEHTLSMEHTWAL